MFANVCSIEMEPRSLSTSCDEYGRLIPRQRDACSQAAAIFSPN
jgi:hypothetical protein